jgi:hypothetical protein
MSSRPKQSTTLVNAKKALTVLQHGVQIVRRAVDGGTRVGAGHDQVHRLAGFSQHITWAYVVGNGVYAADRSAATGDVQVAVIDGVPPPGLDRDAAFQARRGEDSSLRIYVQPQRFTDTWAGIVLFHELGHVLEHLAGVSSLAATGPDWWNAEARAYHRDALIIDALSGGRFLPALTRLTADHSIADLIGRDPDDLSENLYWHAFGGRFPDPARSTAERWARSATLVFGAVIAMDAHPVSLADLSESSAGPELRRAATVWGWNAAEGSAHRPVASSPTPPSGRK